MTRVRSARSSLLLSRSALVIELLYVPALVVLFTPLACDVIHAHTEQRPARNKIFGDHECYAGEAEGHTPGPSPRSAAPLVWVRHSP